MGKVNSEIGRTSIKEHIRMRLWAVSGGRCELCNRILYQDLVYTLVTILTKAESYIWAHKVGDDFHVDNPSYTGGDCWV